MLYWISSFLIILYCAVNRVYMGYPLTAVLILFSIVSCIKGKRAEDFKGYFFQGIKKGLIVSRMLIYIAVNSALWMSSGCIATLLIYSTKAIIPALFLPMCFLICSLFSLMMGSAFATSATIGVIVFIIGCSGGANPAMVAGAIISGVYVGDRSSPVSSSLMLLSTLNDVEHSKAVSMALKSVVIPVIVTAFAYMPLSVMQPVSVTRLSQLEFLAESFNIGFFAVVPAIVLIIACVFRTKMQICLIASIIASIPAAIFYQQISITEIVKYSLNGFYLPENNPLYTVVRGGGIIPMLKTVYILLVSCSLAEVIQNGGLLSKKVTEYLDKPLDKFLLYIKTCGVGLATTMFGSNQTVSIVMTSQLMTNAYRNSNFTNMDKARDISYASVLLSVIPPWSLTVVIPLASIQYQSYKYIPYMFFIFIAPLYNLIVRIKENKII